MNLLKGRCVTTSFADRCDAVATLVVWWGWWVLPMAHSPAVRCETFCAPYEVAKYTGTRVIVFEGRSCLCQAYDVLRPTGD